MSPVTVYSRWVSLPVPLATTWPPATPTCTASCLADRGRQPGHGVADGQRRAHRARSIVAMGDRRTEHGHDAVADMLVDVAAMLGHDPVDALEEGVEERVDLLGVELVGSAV